MNEYESFNEIDVDELVETVGYQFLDFLVEEKMVTESFGKRIKALTEIEEAKDVGMMLTESDRAPASHNRDGIIVPAADVQITYDHFASVWQDFTNYPDRFDIFTAFGVPRKSLQGVKDDAMRRRMDSMLSAYEAAIQKGYHNGPKLVKYGRRRNAYSKVDREREQQQPPTQKDIYSGERGRRNQTTIALDRINAQELLSGEFYSNITRIPRSRWAGWLRFWDRRKSSVRPNRVSKWQKHFLMGYQIDKNILFEIWFNTLDSTFMIHDQNGAELGRPVETLQEAMRYFVTQITTASEQDAEIFAGGGVNNQVANSMMRGVAANISKDSAQAEREAMLAQKSEEDLDRMNDARQQFKVKKLNQQLKSQDRIEYVKGIGRRALEIPADLQRAAYIKMMNTASTVEDKAAVALKASFDYAIKKAKDERELQGYMVTRMQEYMSDDIEKTSDIIKLAKEFLNDPAVRAEIKKRMVDGDEVENERRKQEIRDRVKDAEEKFKEANQKRKDDQDEKTRKEREKAEKKAKKALGDRFSFLDKKKADKKADDIIKKYQNQSTGGKKVNESLDDIDMLFANEEIEREMNSPQMDQQVRSIRAMAERSPYTQAALSAAVMSDMVSTYQTSRAPKDMGQGRLVQWFKKKWFSGRRKNPIIQPTDPAPLWDKMRQAITGKRSRADFVIGYTLSDKVNIEIWYVTEWDFDSNKPVSSFSVFDVSSAKVIRRYLPYYRSAITVAMGKIGLTI